MTTRNITEQTQATKEAARDTADAVATAADQAAATSRSGIAVVGRVVSDAAHAVVGAVDFAIAKARGRSEADVLPEDSGTALDARLRTGFDRFSTRGRRTTGRISDRVRSRSRAVRSDAEDTVEKARSEGASVVSSIGGKIDDVRASTETESRRDARARSDAPERPGVPYEERTVDALRELAAQRSIAGRSTMSKDELVDALRE